MNNVYTVSEINNYIKNMFQRDRMLMSVAVKGEASNVKYHSSGHIYFTLKDESGQMSCVMFASQTSRLTFSLKEGMSVIVIGQITVYERGGNYQMYARDIMQEGIGRLFAAYEELKAKLSKEGLFDASHKKPIPQHTRTIGIVTAATGAAIRDIVNISARRNPYAQLILSPSLVQGEAAPEDIVRALKLVISKKPDVIIVGRGGGSIEDLWAFNDERVARAIYECEIPVISAVGHETDYTIADFVSDLRAPTPSAAAELAVEDITATLGRLVDLRYDLTKAVSDVIERKKKNIELLQARLSAQSPKNKVLTERQFVSEMETRLNVLIHNLVTDRKNRLFLLAEQLKGVSPLNRLSPGYGYISDEKGEPIVSASRLKKGDSIFVQMHDGSFSAKIERKDDTLWR